MAQSAKDRDTLRDKRRKELETLKTSGKIDPEAVVKFARNKRTACHSWFDWNDTTAAHRYRLWQARELIAEFEIFIPETKRTTREFVSLEQDRGDGGYRETRDVMADVGLRTAMLRQSIEAFRRFESQYDVLQEWSDVMTAGEQVIARIEPKKKAG